MKGVVLMEDSFEYKKVTNDEAAASIQAVQSAKAQFELVALRLRQIRETCTHEGEYETHNRETFCPNCGQETYLVYG
jgi:formate dehydrogenase maturation protein FdhE